MKIEVGLFELMGARVSVAFVDSSHITAGNDALIAAIWERLRYKTSWPLMLYSEDGRGYAPFQTHQFANRIRREYAIDMIEIDLDVSFYEYQDEAPF